MRVITAANGYINTIAGNGVPNSKHSGDGGPATSAGLAQPDYVAVDSAGDLYISEAAGSYIRMITADTGIISSIGGTGLDDVNLPGDGGPATAAAIASPTGIALDGFGNIYVGSYVAERIRKINVSESALIYPTPTNVGTADAADDPQTAILTDIGNFQMNVPFATSPANPVITKGWLLDSTSTCSPNGLKPLTLNSGQACTLPVDFTPTASGTNNGTLVLTDNSLNVPTSTQTISLTGTGVGQAAGPQPVLTPATINFGSLTVWTTSAAQTATTSAIRVAFRSQSAALDSSVATPVPSPRATTADPAWLREQAAPSRLPALQRQRDLFPQTSARTSRRRSPSSRSP